ncbi:MAG TPA: phosphotransferase family protein [Gemmatimonadales bacterium]|nr:phosphotransferase family protein [Gemmatimonadales bacterium]
MTVLDDAGPVRAGEELDAGRLADWLRLRLPGSGAVEVSQFPHGHSNLTYLVTRGADQYVLRRPPFGNRVKTAHDMSREFRMLEALAPVFPEAPRPLLYSDDDLVLGAPFYLMERRRGIVLRKTLPEGLDLGAVPAGRLSGAVVECLVRLHAVDWAAAGLGAFGHPEGYVGRQVKGWSERYAAAATETVPSMDTVARWLAERIPPPCGAAVIHNDYKFDNLLLDPGQPSRIVALLDWEMATVGDPLMDLGSALAYWIEPDDPPELVAAAMGPTYLPGMWTRQQVVEAYAHGSGRAGEDIAFYYCFGLFKVAVIIQQIYVRYVRGLTRDPRFAGLNRMVAVLARQAERAMTRGLCTP